MTIIVIVAEGDVLQTEQTYVRKLKKHYGKRGITIDVKVFALSYSCEPQSIRSQIDNFVANHWLAHNNRKVELHAQAGLGAVIAWHWLELFPNMVETVFFVGGAPACAMTGIAKIFHRYISRLWYWSPFQFFADDPNPFNDPEIAAIKASSTAAMRAHPRLYRDELVFLSRWNIPAEWRPPKTCQAFFVPNGETYRPKWWDNSYNNTKASLIWAEHGVRTTERPGNYFSMYSMMPAEDLFEVMDEHRWYHS